MRTRLLGKTTALLSLIMGLMTSGALAASFTFTPIEPTPRDINNVGQIVGTTGSGGFLLNTPQGTPINVPVFANGINDAGQIVGGGFLLNTPQGTPIPINVDGVANGINNAGQIVGTTGSHGFLLNTPQGTPITINVDGATSTSANGINNAGQIVGQFSLPPNPQSIRSSGFLLLTPGGTPTTFNVRDGILGSRVESTRAFGINDAGQIVGTFSDGNGAHGFLLTGFLSTQETFIAFDASTGPGGLTEAYGINNAGQIVGLGLGPGLKGGFLATMVPEPSTVLLLGSGLAALAGFFRRRLLRTTHNSIRRYPIG